MTAAPSTYQVAPARRRPVPLGLALLGVLVGFVGLSAVRAAGAAAAAPPGWRVVATEALGPGVEHQTLRVDQPAQDVHVARLAPGNAWRLLPVLAKDVLGGPSSGPEATSSMCARVKCVAAVNGDFFDNGGRPVGAMVAAGELLTTPGIDHILLRVDRQGQPTMRPGIDWSVGVTTADGRTLMVQGVNRPLKGEGIALYSRRWGSATAADPGAVEVVLQLPPPATAILPTGASAVGVGPAVSGGNVPIPAGQVVLSGRGAGARAVADLAQRAAGVGVLNVSVGSTVSAIGGSPQLLQNGRLNYPAGNPDAFTQNRYARTVVGVTPSGEILLVTADGGRTNAGLTLAETAQLLTGLGATDALNLDGGGSTTFVTGGAVRNAPSDGLERGVASSLAVMVGGAAAAGTPADPVASLLTQVTNSLNSLLQPPK